MSTRQMAARYSRGGGGGIGDLDLFGMKSRRRINEAQQMSDIDVNAEKELERVRNDYQTALEKLKAEHAKEITKNAALMQYFKDQNIAPVDSKGNINPVVDTIVFNTSPIQAETLQTGAETERAKAKTGKEYFESERGRRSLTTGIEGQTLEPAFKTANIFKPTVGPGEIGQFYNPMSLTDQPSTGVGAIPIENKPSFDLTTGKPTMISAPSMSLGRFNPSPDVVRRMIEQQQGGGGVSTGVSMTNPVMGSRALADQESMKLQTMPTSRDETPNLINTLLRALGVSRGPTTSLFPGRFGGY